MVANLQTANIFRCILLVIIIITTNYLYPQDQLYFNNRYDLSIYDTWDAVDNIIELDDGYLVSGGTGHAQNQYWHVLAFMKLDKNGNKEWIKYLGDTIQQYYNGSSGSLIALADGNFVFGGGVKYPGDPPYDKAMICKLDENCDTIWTKKYGNTDNIIDTANIGRQVKETYDTGYILIGEQYYYGATSKILLIKADSLGNSMWEQTFGIIGMNQGHSIIQTYDYGSVIGAYNYIPGIDNSGDPIVIKTDSIGNQQWLKNLGGPFKDYKAMVCPAPDGNIIIGTNYADEMFNPNIAYSRINIIKLDDEGNEIWNKKYGESVIHKYLLNVITLNDGSIIAVGSVYKPDPEPERMGWVLKTNVDGDSIWYREYNNLLGDESRNYLYDIIQTADTGFVACGFVLPVLPDTGSQDTWVIKLDSIGCDTAGCDPTVAIIENEEMWSIGDGKMMVLYPNPASDRINFRLSVIDCRFSIYVYDMFGRKMEEIEIPRDQKQIQINISSYPRGLYIAVLKTSKGIIARKKFVILSSQ